MRRRRIVKCGIRMFKKVTGGALPERCRTGGRCLFPAFTKVWWGEGPSKDCFSNALCYTQNSILFNEKVITDTVRKGIPAKECG